MALYADTSLEVLGWPLVFVAAGVVTHGFADGEPDDDGDDEGLGTTAASFGLITASVPFADWPVVSVAGEEGDGIGVFSEPGAGVVLTGGVVVGPVDVGGVEAGGDETGGEDEVGGVVAGAVTMGGVELCVPVGDDPSERHFEAAGSGAAE